ncbi:HECT-domain-containing protein [Tilletiaria anomala UBC 951]|uniref:HECT-type E3 ubiquitin transferase n=1 Tax=Tilletiaria anomala (strain ATCC 24038 / CBS 436.72 / UBC 951) TaxID=1037660 RepID=A0A066WK06_TILAU|nr:HECT-domain-containing protein [Tilletiaria anomala UBC 951]KDN51329.1 HECT-domain-containing protein [Tilletiaria anomala UBC 951]
MDFNFTGIAKSRPAINLGGQLSSQTSASLAANARQQRQQREQLRRKEAAAQTVQRVWRGRRAAECTRRGWEADLGRLLAEIEARVAAEGTLACRSTEVRDQWLAATSLLVFATKAKAEHVVVDNSGRLERWCRLALTPMSRASSASASTATDADAADTQLPVVLYSFFESTSTARFDEARWRAFFLLSSVARRLEAAVQNPTLAKGSQMACCTFFKTLLFLAGQDPGTEKALRTIQIASPRPDVKCGMDQRLVGRLLRQGAWFSSLRRHLLTHSVDRKASPDTVSLCIQLCFAPFKVFTSPTQTGASGTSRANPIAIEADAGADADPTGLFPSPAEAYRLALRQFTEQIMTIPLLPKRIPLSSLTQLVAASPFNGIVGQLSSSDTLTLCDLHVVEQAHLLANFLALSAGRVPHITDGKTLKAYLESLTAMQDAVADSNVLAHIPASARRQERGKGKAGVASTPPASAAAGGQGKRMRAAVEMIEDEEEREHGHIYLAAGHGDQAMAPPGASTGAVAATEQEQLDDQTYRSLLILPSLTHINAIVAASNRFSASSRPALFRFLTSTLNAGWPIDIRDDMLSNILYSNSNPAAPPGMAAAGGDAARSAASATGGLVREIWRGWVRASPLATRLTASGGGTDAVPVTSQAGASSGLGGDAVGADVKAFLGTLGDPALANEWPALIVLCELYSRTLLTVGDDEFYPPSSASPSSSSPLRDAVTAPLAASRVLVSPASASSGGSSRNPLSLDEVVSLSALLRNLTFAMYWHEGNGSLATLQPIVSGLAASGAKRSQPPAGVATGGASGTSVSPFAPAQQQQQHVNEPDCLPGMKMSLLSLRTLFTKLLQQLYARDSRREFTPEGHWLMVSQFDMQAFIQTVIMEETELAGPAAGTAATDQVEEEDVDEDGDRRMGAGAQAHRLAANTRSDNMDGGDSDIPALPVSIRLRARRGRTQGLTARTLAFLSPRLGVLNNIPFVIPFEVRVEIFRQFIRNDAQRLGIEQHAFMRPRRHRIKVRRGHVADDGFAQLNLHGDMLKHPIEIAFIDEWGQEEAGIDGGGLFKEFLTSLVKEVFDTDRGLWCATNEQEIYPNPHSYAQTPESLEWYTFLGRILGKAMYEGILVDVKFASFFLSKWLGKQSYLDDLSSLGSLDKELYKGLIYLKNYPGDVEADLALNFTVTDEEFGVQHTTELVPGGSSIAVTRENRLSYIYRVSHYRLTAQIARQCRAFFNGLSEMIDPRWLRMMNREELRVIVSGADQPIDIDDLKANTVLAGYHEKDLAVEYFWNALATFDDTARRALLKFVTSCPSPPLLGFSQLNPKFAIQHSSDDSSRLPTASTCINLLKLPRYTSQGQCLEKLRYAIQANSGFDLS